MGGIVSMSGKTSGLWRRVGLRLLVAGLSLLTGAGCGKAGRAAEGAPEERRRSEAEARGDGAASTLELDFGRSEVRVFAEAYRLPVGKTVVEINLPERLERLGYQRVKGRRPEQPGEYFWGNEVFAIYRRSHWHAGSWESARQIAVRLGPGGRIAGPEGSVTRGAMPWLEPEVLAESLAADRAPRRTVRLADLPERVWRPLLAIEDSPGGLEAAAGAGLATLGVAQTYPASRLVADRVVERLEGLTVEEIQRRFG